MAHICKRPNHEKSARHHRTLRCAHQRLQAINAELDRYLLELSRLEFNMDVEELQAFTQELEACNDEIQRSAILHQAVEARGIELPFEVGNAASTRNWLASLV